VRYLLLTSRATIAMRIGRRGGGRSGSYRRSRSYGDARCGHRCESVYTTLCSAAQTNLPSAIQQLEQAVAPPAAVSAPDNTAAAEAAQKVVSAEPVAANPEEINIMDEDEAGQAG
jgi:hypothetical protein